MANPKVEAAYFWVQNGPDGDKKFVKGADFKNVATGSEVVWVQRGTTGAEKYRAWYGQPENVNNPDLTYRFNYFEAPGPYPTNEWRNIRHVNETVLDLDGKTLVLKDNTEIKDGDVCRITHSGGMENWYVFDTSDENNFIKFKTIYTREDGRERVDVKRKGSRPKPDGSQELVLSIYKKSNLKPYNKIADTDWVWAQTTESDGSIKKWKVNGLEFKKLFLNVTPNFEVLEGIVNMSLTFSNTSKVVEVVKAEDGETFECRGSATHLHLPVGNYFVPTLEAGGLNRFNMNFTHGNGNFDFKSNFDFSTVENAAYFLYNCQIFNGEIDHLDFSNVTNMNAAFERCYKFNGSLENFNPSNVTCVYTLFRNCRSFNQPINHLVFPKVNSWSYCFNDCHALNQSVRGIQYNNGASLDSTFNNCVSMNHPNDAVEFPFPPHVRLYAATSGWSGFKQSIANWTQPLPYVTTGLFFNWGTFNQDVSHLNISNCEQIIGWFGKTNFNNDSFKDWDFTNSNVISIQALFSNARSFNPVNSRIFSNWDVSNIKDMNSLFRNSKIGCSTNHVFDFSDWDTSNVTSTAYMFANTTLIEPNISTWDVSNVTNMSGMFQNTTMKQDLSSWDVRNVTNMSYTFQNFGVWTGSSNPANMGYDEIGLNFEHWKPHKVNQFRYAFDGFSSAIWMKPFELYRWRMPRLPARDNGEDRNPMQKWFGGSRYWGILGNPPAFTLEPISPSYKPDFTIVLSTDYENKSSMIVSKNRYSRIVFSNGWDLYDATNYGDYSFQNNLDMVVDIFAPTNGDSLVFGGFVRSSYAMTQNWKFAEPHGEFPELVNAPTNLNYTFSAKPDNNNGWYNVTGFEHINTSNVTHMEAVFSGMRRPPRVQMGEVLIGNWDVSNATTMNYFFSDCEKDSIRFGDLRGWCVQNITSKPEGWPLKTSGLVEKDPCWGECPPDGEIGECGGDSANKPMPDGAWASQHQQYYITIDESAGKYDQYYIVLSTSCQLWRAQRGTTNFSKRSNSSAFYLDKNYDWIVTSRYSNDRITFEVSSGRFKFVGADTANVTNMSNMFKNSTYFNDDIGWWDTSNVRNMRNMFANARNFNQDLSGWNVSMVSCSRDFDRNTNNWSSAYKPNL
jgi:surface protein